jgi:hypothetical protein
MSQSRNTQQVQQRGVGAAALDRRQWLAGWPLGIWCLPVVARAAAAEEKQSAEAAVERLLDRVIASEERMMREVGERSPIVETYIQEEGSAEVRDHYFLGRLKLVESVDYVSFVKRSEEAPAPARRVETRGKLRLPFFRKGEETVATAPERFAFLPVGFAQMALIDARDFNRETYQFDFVRREFLGEVRCLVFDIGPRNPQQAGKFVGRIWVEDQDACIVRLNGTYTLRSAEGIYFHFDSWRVQAAPALWVPATIYIEDRIEDRASNPGEARFKGQTRIWNYDPQVRKKLDELTSMLVESDTGLNDKAEKGELSPLESQRRWEREAEMNVIDRLERIGLVAPAGDVDRILNTVLNNLIVTSELDVEARCRLLLTTPLETFTIGQTVVISRGLVDVLPDEASLALTLAMELAHIALAHPTRTEYAFNDRTMVGDEAVLERFRFSRTPEEVASAMKKASLMLANSPYKEKLGGAGLFLKALQQRSPILPRLIQATLGNDLSMYLKTPEFVELLEKAPPMEDTKLEQIAALPLGSRIRLEPWANQTYMMKTKALALLSAREKMPFEIAPVNLRLTRLPRTGAKP